MNISELRGLLLTGHIREGILKSTGQGWAVALEDETGQQFPLTDNTGHEKHYHSLDNATSILRDMGVSNICVVENF
ncbi:MAG: hypothetical protein ACRBB6_09710 [Neptuniibacter sp.]